MKAKRGVKVELYSFFNLSGRLGWVSTLQPGRSNPVKEIR